MKKYLFAALLIVGLALVLAPPQAFAQEDKPFTVHGEVRMRGEYDNNATDFDNDTTDGGLFWPYRVRIAVEGKFTKNVDGYIEVQSTGIGGGDSSFLVSGLGAPTSQNPRWAGNGTFQDTGLYQGYVTLNELWSKSFSLRIGRQEIVAGNKFLLGDEEWYAGISHDGVVGMWHMKKVDIKAWYTRPYDSSSFFNGGGNAFGDLPPGLTGLAGNGANVDFFGGYVTFPIHKTWGVDAYLMDINDRGLGGSWQTFGGRFFNDNWNKGGLIWNVEYAMQAGKIAGGASAGVVTDLDANGKAGEALVGWNFKSKKNMHRIYGKYEYASGDDPTSTDKFEGFAPLYGDIHGRTGMGDWFQVSAFSTLVGGGVGTGFGLKAWSVGYDGHFGDRHEIGVAYWDYKADDDQGSPDGDALGTAIDIWYGFNYSKNVAFQAAYSELSPGDALTASGAVPDDSAQRLYGQVRLRF
ncbi:MAG TPA: alginate export family protein [Patescibacteria group bacterium]|nr:alginate export family protein [Patescibacteria group bacterium]